MSKFYKCIYGGGGACLRQGGDGSLLHSVKNFHKFPTTLEIPAVGDVDVSLNKGQEVEVTVEYLEDLEEEFDDDLYKSILNVSLDAPVLMSKSLYNIDINTEEGIERVLELLPIIDEEILFDLYQEVFPGYPTTTLDAKMARVELRGYFMDYLEWLNEEGYES